MNTLEDQFWSPADMLERLGSDTDLVRELVALFLADYPRMIGAVRESVAGGNAEAMRRAAHAVKGSIGTFTDGPPHELAFELEQIARAGRLDQGAAVFSRLEQAAEVFVGHLREFDRSLVYAA